MNPLLLLVCLLLLGTGETVSAQDSPLTTILPAKVKPDKLPPGKAIKITYNWDAVPMGTNYTVFVHIEDKYGNLIAQNDHQPPFPVMTSNWRGKISYTETVNFPANTPEGTYRITAGLYDKATGRQVLQVGEGAVDMGPSGYKIGEVTLDKNAPPPTLDSEGPVSLSLKGYHLTFDDEFTALSISDWGPISKKARWIAHTPTGADFGDAQFTSPESRYSPFTIVGEGLLRIRASKQDGKWRSGILSTLDPHGHGFTQQYGYWEMRAKLPKGLGTWPAFWLLSSENVVNRSLPGFEIDILEQYGVGPQALHTTVHWWYPKGGPPNRGAGNNASVGGMTDGFHTYGFLWDEKWMIFYYDGVEIWRYPTPEEAKQPMYTLVNLAMGGGWPITETPNPSDMLVDYVRIYSKDPKAPVHPSVGEAQKKK